MIAGNSPGGFCELRHDSAGGGRSGGVQTRRGFLRPGKRHWEGRLCGETLVASWATESSLGHANRLSALGFSLSVSKVTPTPTPTPTIGTTSRTATA